MNITLSADEQLIRAAREIARRQGTSLNEMVRRYLRTVVGRGGGQATADDLLRLMNQHGGRSGKRFSRADAYEDRL